jgi:hypothetical protein
MTRTAIELRNLQIDFATDALAGGHLQIFAGEQPAGPETPAGAASLASFVLPDLPFAPAVDGATSAAYLAPVFATSAGRSGWFRLSTREGLALIDGAATAPGAGGELELEHLDIATGDRVEISQLTLRLPA